MTERAWVGAEDSALTWLQSVATSDSDIGGYDVGPMPDKVFVLHPLFERIDGGRMTRLGEEHEDDLRAVSWREYAERRGIPLLVGRGYTSGRDALPGAWFDEFVSPPDEGSLHYTPVRDAVLRTLLDHTSDIDQPGTAYFYDFWFSGEEFDDEDPPNVQRGPLRAWEDLWDRSGYVLTPQNLWPDDHSWVLTTHVDSWSTEVSGSTALIDDLIASPALEAVRLPHLHRT